MKRFVLLMVLLCVAVFAASCDVLDLVDEMLYEEDGGYWDEDWDDKDWDDEDYDDWDDGSDSTDESEAAVYSGTTYEGNPAGAISCVTSVNPFDSQSGSIPSVDVSDWVSEETEVLALVNYDVSNDTISSPDYERDIPSELDGVQNNTAIHEQIWEFFTALIPSDFRTYLVEFQVMTDGEDEILASVYQTTESAYEWGLEVDVMDIDDTYEFFATLVHEYGHLLSLNPSQVEPSVAIFTDPEDDDVYYAEADACPNYFPGEGCSKADSYINLFVEAFWNDLYDEWLDVDNIEDEDKYYDALDQFYYDHEDEFVSDYAVTNPDEDFAESFSAFVMEPTPDGNTVAEEKILLFYRFSELVVLRDNIISNLCSMVD